MAQKLSQIASAMMKQIAALNKAIGTTPLETDDIAILGLLQREDQLTPTQIISKSGIPRSTVSRRLQRLVELDLVSESVDTKDFRKSSYRNTSKGDGLLFELGRLVEFDCAEFAAQHGIVRTVATEPADFASRIIMLALLGQTEPATVAQICQLSGYERSRVAMSLKRLARLGLAEKDTSCAAHKADARTSCWSLTPLGEQKICLIAEKLS